MCFINYEPRHEGIWKCAGIAVYYCYLAANWRRLALFKTAIVLSRRISSLYSLHRMLDEPQSCCLCCGIEKYYFPTLGMEPWPSSQ
jgi:hypothetical protein